MATAKVMLCKWVTPDGNKGEMKGGFPIPFLMDIIVHSCSDKEIEEIQVILNKTINKRRRG